MREVGDCWNGSPYQPVPIARDVAQDVALRFLEQPEDYPGVLAEQESVRAYPGPFGINLAHVLGYLSPITEEELDAAEADGDRSVNGASSVGRAGVERQYDRWLRGMPGYKSVAVDSMGRVLGDDGEVAGQPGDTLVTSIDAKVQSVVEQQLLERMEYQRTQRDPVTGRNYVADSGAAVVMEADTGRIVAMASQPTYDPGVWVGGITKKQLARLYSEAAGNPLLGRATQGQFAPGSTWKPFMTAGALTNGYSPDARLNCSSAFRVGNRDFKNYESGAYGYIGFAKALEVSCNTFFYRIGFDYWQRFGSDVADVDAKDPLVEEAKEFGFGSETGIDLPGEAPGRIADRAWKREYYRSMKDYYCEIAAKPQDAETSDFVYLFAREFCAEGYAYRAGDAVNFAIGQGDTLVTPLQLAQRVRRDRQRRHALRATHREGDRQPRRRGAPAIRAQEGRERRRTEGHARLHRLRAQGRRGQPVRHHELEAPGLPARPGRHPRQDRLGRGHRQADDRLGGVVHRGLRRRDDDQPGRHRIGLDRRRDPQDLGDALRRGRGDRAARPRRDPGYDASDRPADVHSRRHDPAPVAGRRPAQGGLRCALLGSTGSSCSPSSG